MVGRSISGTQKDVDTKSDSDRCVAMAADGLQLSTFRVSKDEPGRRWERHTISMRPPITLVKTFQIPETSISANNATAPGAECLSAPVGSSSLSPVAMRAGSLWSREGNSGGRGFFQTGGGGLFRRAGVTGAPAAAELIEVRQCADERDGGEHEGHLRERDWGALE